jgi:pseudouridine kinase
MMTISVIGTVFVDIKGYGNAKINAETKNVGNIEFANGGVGRNVAEAIARAGGNVEFFSSVDVTAQGAAVVQGLRDLGIKTDRMVKCSQGMGMWLAVLGGDGDLVASVSQVPDLKPLEAMLLQQGEEIVKNSKALVMEFDLAEEVVDKMFTWAKQHGKPVYGIVGNLEVIRNRPSIINGLELFICNKGEAEEYLNRSLTSVEECKEAARELTKGGLKVAVITMGEQGSVFYDSRVGEWGYVPTSKVEVLDTTGAGDSFFSGTVYGLCQGFDLEHAVRCGTQMAAWTISSKCNVAPEISEGVKNSPIFAGAALVN